MMAPDPDIRVVIDKENTCKVIGMQINKEHFKKMSLMYPAVWCDYPRPLFAGDTSCLTDPYEDE